MTVTSATNPAAAAATDTAPAVPVDARGASTEQAPPLGEPDLVEEDLLVEDVSIDGMCGVY